MEVVTLTGNLLAEWTIGIVNLQRGSTHRAETISFQVGGKGINVTRILSHLGVSTEAHGFASGPLGQQCQQWLNEKDIQHRFHPLETGVRPGMVIRESGNPESKETTFLGLDLAIPTASWQIAMQEIASQKPRWLAICGSIPGWQAAWMKHVEELIAHYQIEVCIDTYGSPLEDLVKLPVELVKVNKDELRRLVPEMENGSALDLLAEASASSPVKNWIITDGPNPILAAFSNGEIYEVQPAWIKEVSAMGSGDTFLAALMQQSINNAGPEEMLQQAAACATANAASAGIADFELPVPERYKPVVSRLS